MNTRFFKSFKTLSRGTFVLPNSTITEMISKILMLFVALLIFKHFGFTYRGVVQTTVYTFCYLVVSFPLVLYFGMCECYAGEEREAKVKTEEIPGTLQLFTYWQQKIQETFKGMNMPSKGELTKYIGLEKAPTEQYIKLQE